MRFCSRIRNRLTAGRTTLLIVATVATLTLAGTVSGVAQAAKSGGAAPPDPSRFELYLGYGYIRPVNSDINNYFYKAFNPGGVASATAYFNRHLGLQLEGNIFPDDTTVCYFSAQAGPVFRFNRGRLVPFVHALGGAAKIGGPVSQACTWGWGATAGGGVDYVLPYFNNRFALRPVQADLEYSHVDYGTSRFPTDGGIGKIIAYRLSAGVVIRLGATATPPPVQLGCTVQPVDVFPGDPLQVTAVPANLNGNRTATYTWTTTGGKVSPGGETATVSTAGLAAGDYTVNGHVTQGIRPGMSADCAAGFRVHAYEPPSLSCAANPSTVTPGQTSTITATASSPQNRTTTYSFTASSGQVVAQSGGNGAVATLTTAGDTPGTVTVTCTAVDDLGHQATATALVGINTPPVPVAPSVRNLCSLSFDRDRRRPVRVDNESKACLDDIALTLNRESTGKLVIVGHHSDSETPDSAAQRALNVEQYLMVEKGVDPSRIELRIGDTPGRTVDNTLVPAGASFDSGSTATFDGASVRRRGQPYGKVRPPKTR